jgi:hypothetical protein
VCQEGPRWTRARPDLVRTSADAEERAFRSPGLARVGAWFWAIGPQERPPLPPSAYGISGPASVIHDLDGGCAAWPTPSGTPAPPASRGRWGRSWTLQASRRPSGLLTKLMPERHLRCLGGRGRLKSSRHGGDIFERVRIVFRGQCAYRRSESRSVVFAT